MDPSCFFFWVLGSGSQHISSFGAVIPVGSWATGTPVSLTMSSNSATSELAFKLEEAMQLRLTEAEQHKEGGDIGQGIASAGLLHAGAARAA